MNTLFMFRFVLVLFFPVLLIAQTHVPAHKAPPKSVDPKEAAEKYNNRDYRSALDDYLSLIKLEPENEEYLSRIADCYLNTNINKKLAVSYLEQLTTKEKYNPNWLFDLGKAYHYAYRFDDAIEAFTRFKEKGKGKSDNLKEVEHFIQYCINAKELVKYPLDVTFENLGKNINSPFPDYYPFVPVNETFIVYNSRRGNNSSLKDIDGSFLSGIFISKVKDGEFQKSKNIGPPINNGEGDMEVVGLSCEGDMLLLWRFDPALLAPTICLATQDKSKNFKNAEALDETINSKNSEIAAAITADGNTLYFSSDRSGGLGGKDIYVSRKLPTGKWGPPFNLGTEVNTPYDEDFPNISPDEKTIYFSSKGHNSMGGYDICRMTWDENEQKWGNVKNMGYPLNTPDDDINLRISQTGRYGYVSQVREGGLGDLDIYRITFNEVDPNYAIIQGQVSFDDTLTTVKYNQVNIQVHNTKTNKLFGKYLPNPITGRYIIVAPAGEYSVTIEIPGFNAVREKVTIADKIATQVQMEKSFVLLPAGSEKKDVKQLNKKF